MVSLETFLSTKHHYVTDRSSFKWQSRRTSESDNGKLPYGLDGTTTTTTSLSEPRAEIHRDVLKARPYVTDSAGFEDGNVFGPCRMPDTSETRLNNSAPHQISNWLPMIPRAFGLQSRNQCLRDPILVIDKHLACCLPCQAWEMPFLQRDEVYKTIEEPVRWERIALRRVLETCKTDDDVKVRGEVLRVVWPFIIRSNRRRQVNNCELAHKKGTMLLRATIQAVFGNRTLVLRLRKPLAIVLSSP